MHTKVLAKHLAHISRLTLKNQHTEARLYIAKEVLEHAPKAVEYLEAVLGIETLFVKRQDVSNLRNYLTEEYLIPAMQEELTGEEITAIWECLR